MRIGFGKDIHKTKRNAPLVLGGVRIESKFGLDSYSDGDVVIHAICDAILGALNMGDIGKMFPSNDEQYKNISSLYFLEKMNEIIKNSEYLIENLDVFISCEKPKLAPYTEEMQKVISTKLDIKNDQVSIKCGTYEGLGAIGKSKAIEAECVVLLRGK